MERQPNKEQVTKLLLASLGSIAIAGLAIKDIHPISLASLTRRWDNVFGDRDE